MRAVMCGSIISLLQRRLSELFRRLQKSFYKQRHTSTILQGSILLQWKRDTLPTVLQVGAAAKVCSSFSSFCFERLANSTWKQTKSCWGCERNPKWFFLRPGIIPLAHPKRTACSSTPHAPPSLQSRACANKERSLLRPGNAPGTALIHHILQGLADALGKHGVIWEEDLRVRTGPVKVAVIQLCVLCALKSKIQSKIMQVMCLHKEHQQIILI